MFKFKPRQTPLGAGTVGAGKTPVPLWWASPEERAQRQRDADRRRLLDVAANLTTHRSLPGAVMANLVPLQEWVDQADGDRDRRARVDALGRADDNRRWSNGRLTVCTPDDDPDRLIADAEPYYRYLTGQLPLPA